MTVSDETLEKIIHWKCEKEDDAIRWLRFCAYQWNIFYGSTHEYVEDGEWLMEFITGGVERKRSHFVGHAQKRVSLDGILAFKLSWRTI